MSTIEPIRLDRLALRARRHHPPGDLVHGAKRLRAATLREGLTAVDVRQVLDSSMEGHQRALGFLLGTETTAPRRLVREVLEILEERLGVADLGASAVLTPLERCARRLADAVGALAGIVAGYVVIGGLIEGDSLLLGHGNG